MSKATYTKGPWEEQAVEVGGQFTDDICILSVDQCREVASISRIYNVVRDMRVEEANARLIAAAPDLLEALQQAHIELASIYHTYRDVVRPGCLIGKEKTALQYVIDAIAKATGAA